MSRDWSEDKKAYPHPYDGDSYTVKLLLEAIAEIEQLRQEKAELVLSLSHMVRMLNSAVELYDVPLHGSGDCFVRNAEKLLTKLGGGEPNAKP